MRVPRNPYVAGNPVGDSPAFIGRADVLRAVLRILRHDQQNAIVLYGQRRIGKTSILQHLKVRLPQEGPYFPVYFDLQDKAALPLGRVLEELAAAIAYALDQAPPALGPDQERSFRDEWLPAVLRALPEGSAVVLLLDEFDVLAYAEAHQAAKAFFPYLRGLLTSDPARLQFEFVIGRNVDDLDNIALSVFKGTPAQRISMLSREDCVALVRLSEDNDTLFWSEEALDRVWALTNGHPFLTQQLCSHVWERSYDQAPAEPPLVAPQDVDAAIPEALDASRNTMEWLWDGLPPAERVVASALAEAGAVAITPEGLERLLYDSGVRIVIRELQSAPQLLQDWDLIEPTDGGYRFRVELLRRWLAENKPLQRVQEELDHLEPVAENLYQAALGLYQGEQLENALDLLQRAVALNPNHVRANQLLADLLLAEGRTREAVELLEPLFQYQPAAARPRLVQALLAQVQTAGSDAERLERYERVLALDPAQPEAAAAKQRIWQRRGDAALAADDLEAALDAYRAAGNDDAVARVQEEIDRRALAAELEALNQAEDGGAYEEALARASRLAETHPQARDWAPELARLERLAQIDERYRQGVAALPKGELEQARQLLSWVAAQEPDYKEVTRYLELAVAELDRVERADAGQARRALWPGWRLALLPVVLIVAALIIWLAFGGTPAKEQEVAGTMGATPAEEQEVPGAMGATPAEEQEVPGAMGGTISLRASWAEFEDMAPGFRAMVAPFEQDTGIEVLLESMEERQSLADDPPNVAQVGLGDFRQLMEAGVLLPLDDLLDLQAVHEQYPAGLLDPLTRDGRLYGIPADLALKSLVWYCPAAFEAAGYEVPTTWGELDDLEARIIDEGSAPWCIGLGSDEASGWPGTDWIEDIVVRTAGPDGYDAWWRHEATWEERVVADAWEIWGTIVNDPRMVYGGEGYVRSVDWNEAAGPLFEGPAGCFMHRQGDFLAEALLESIPELAVGEDLDFFVLPPIDPDARPLLVGGEAFVLFADEPQAAELMAYLATEEAQQLWADESSFLSANLGTSYPDDPVRQRLAEILAAATDVRFDASDMMPAEVGDAFCQGALQFVGHPEELPRILREIEEVAMSAYPWD
jgi:alpha-glucoside transport system substrate-binding protein